MGEQTAISWTDSTINVWHGCAKVDELCRHCYAEVSTPVRVKRAAGLEVWGPKAARSETKSWERDLRKWDTAARDRGASPWRVFGQSLSDTFEGRADLDPLRARFFAAIERYDALTFQLLTKRPENILRMVPPAWLEKWPAHVWIGTSVGDQASAEQRIPHILLVPARVRFLSVEPMLEALDLTRVITKRFPGTIPAHVEIDGLRGYCGPTAEQDTPAARGLQWVICGGESGSKARPFDLAWARSLRDQCRAAGVAFFMKQMGANPRGEGWHTVRDSHGADPAEWPADLCVQEFPLG